MSIPYKDLHDSPEDERITQIVEEAMKGKRVAFCTDDEEGKADRYIEKLQHRYPELVVVNRFVGPTRGAVTVVVQKE